MAKLISFEPRLHPEIERLQKNDESVSCINCNVKEAMDGNGFEVVAVKKSMITNSPKKFVISAEDKEKLGGTASSELSELQEIETVAVHRKVCITGKILSVGPVEEVKSKSCEKSFRKQECTIADKSCECRFVVWEELAGMIEKGKSYKVTDVNVRMYGGNKSLVLIHQ